MSIPDISVLVPVYNMEAKLMRSLSTVLTQRGVNIEVICVDDGSKDKSRELIKGIQKEDSRVALICQHNSGAGAARNRAMEAAKGKYIFFLDPDDWLPDNDVLDCLHERCEKDGLNVAGGNVEFYLSSGARMNRTDPRFDFAGEGYISFETYQHPGFFQRYLFRRDFIVENGFKFPNYRRFQDPIFLMRVLSTAGKIGITNKVVYCYESDSSHIAWNVEKLNHYYSAVEEMFTFAIDKGYEKLTETAVDCMLDYGAITELLSCGSSEMNKVISLFKQAIRVLESRNSVLAERLRKAKNRLEVLGVHPLIRKVYKDSRKMKWELREQLRACMWKYCPSLPNLRNRIRASR